MKGSCIIGVVLLSLCCAFGNVAQISQDSVQFNLGTGEIQFNNDPVSLTELGLLIQDSYSVAVNIWADAAAGVRENRFPTYSPDTIVQVLESIQESGVEPELVRTSAITVPMRDNSASTDHVRFISESRIEVNNKVFALDQVTPEIFKKSGSPFGLWTFRNRSDFWLF